MANDSELVSNRRAHHDYEVLETFEAGIALLGTEIKSLRSHGGSLQDAYIMISESGIILLKNASISPYKFGNIHNHEERRERKLLMHKTEILKLKKFSQEKGFTLIPLSFYLKKGLVKVKVAVCRGKKAHDKRAALQAKEHKRSIERAMKNSE